ncbi:MAG TPA: SRPBCC domain-containing protein [Pseudonocardiaceae bacterium]
MLIENSFPVAAEPDHVFDFLQDAHNVVACFPGAELLDEVGDDTYLGRVKIKVGPVTATYAGTATIVSRDPATRTAVLRAEGKDSRGAGTANATARMHVEPADDGATVQFATDLAVSGKLAQFGRGVMSDVSARMVAQLAEAVRDRIQTAAPPPNPDPADETGAPAAAATPPATGHTPGHTDAPALTGAPGTTGTAAAVSTGVPATGAGTPSRSTASSTGSPAPATASSPAAGHKPGQADHAPAPTTGARATTTSTGAPGNGTGAASPTTATPGNGTETPSPAAQLAPGTGQAAAPHNVRTAAHAPAPVPATLNAGPLIRAVIAGFFRRLFARLRRRS